MKELYFSLNGRISRSTYWLKFMLPYIVASTLATVLDVALGTMDPELGIGPITSIFYLLALWPAIAVNVKRLHDRNRSGWFLLLGLIPLVNIWILIELWFLKGTEGTNQYGKDPLA